MRPRMLRPWSLERPVAHLMGQVAPSCLLFWPILWAAWVLGRAPRVLEEAASMSRRYSPPSWYEPSSFHFLRGFTSLDPSGPHLPSYRPCGSPFSAAVDPCSLLTWPPVDLTSQGSPNSHPSEELLKQPDYSDKIKQMLGKHQGQPRGGGWGAPAVELGKAGVLPLSGQTWEGQTWLDRESIALPGWSSRVSWAYLCEKAGHSSRILLLTDFCFH